RLRRLPVTYRVVVWSTGNVGKNAIIGVTNRSDLELVGVWVSNPDKVGRDAGELARLDQHLGVAATNDVDAILALQPDCIVTTERAADRSLGAMAEMEKRLRAGISGVAGGPVLLQSPVGAKEPLARGVTAAALEGGASLHVNGVDPGFGN